jgi:hypothetical protein
LSGETDVDVADAINIEDSSSSSSSDHHHRHQKHHQAPHMQTHFDAQHQPGLAPLQPIDLPASDISHSGGLTTSPRRHHQHHEHEHHQHQHQHHQPPANAASKLAASPNRARFSGMQTAVDLSHAAKAAADHNRHKHGGEKTANDNDGDDGPAPAFGNAGVMKTAIDLGPAIRQATAGAGGRAKPTPVRNAPPPPNANANAGGGGGRKALPSLPEFMSARDSRTSRVSPNLPPRRDVARASPSALAFGRDAFNVDDNDDAMRNAAVDALLRVMPQYAGKRDNLLRLPGHVWDEGDETMAPSTKGAIEISVAHGIANAQHSSNGSKIKSGRNTTARDIVRQYAHQHNCFALHNAMHLLLLSANGATPMDDSDRPANIVRTRRKNGGDDARFAVDLRANYGGDPLPSEHSRQLHCMFVGESLLILFLLFDFRFFFFIFVDAGLPPEGEKTKHQQYGELPPEESSSSGTLPKSTSSKKRKTKNYAGLPMEGSDSGNCRFVVIVVVVVVFKKFVFIGTTRRKHKAQEENASLVAQLKILESRCEAARKHIESCEGIHALIPLGQVS